MSFVDAGDFTTWLADFRAARSEEGGMDVPCGTCTACCESAQFVHVGPDEADTLARIPPVLLVPAPGRPPGHWVMGYDEHGRCPMLVDGGCSIYEHRPRTCRAYDCRVFAAAGIEPDQPLVAERVRQWEWQDDPAAEAARADIRSAAQALRHAGAGPVEAALRAVGTA
jgi:Fe-S-cluster containining protein